MTQIFESAIATIEKKHLPYRCREAYEAWIASPEGTLRAAVLAGNSGRSDVEGFAAAGWPEILEALHVGRRNTAEAVQLRKFRRAIRELLADNEGRVGG